MSNEIVVRNQLTPIAWEMIMGVAASMFDGRSQLGIVKQGEAAIKLLFCYENNLPLTTAVTGLYIVNSRLAVMSNVIAAKFKQHPDYDFKIAYLDNDGCRIEVLKNGKVIEESIFNDDDAKRAKLLTKDVWVKYPRNMYFGRAMTNACRWYAPDLFNQPVYVPEELGVKVDGEGAPVIEGSYEIQPEKEEEPVITLQDLARQYGGPETVANVCSELHTKGLISSVMPSSQDDLKVVADTLAEMEKINAKI